MKNIKYIKYLDTKKFRKNNPEKIKAHRKVYVGKRNGSIKQKPCIECGNKKSEAHHEDYSKPLEIIWLCKKHHIVYDSERRMRTLLNNMA